VSEQITVAQTKIGGLSALDIKGINQQKMELLKALVKMPHFKVFVDIVNATKKFHTDSMLTMRNGDEILKQAGMIVGLDYTLVQVMAMIQSYDANELRRLQKERNESPQ
jgi:hypothetical protein